MKYMVTDGAQLEQQTGNLRVGNLTFERAHNLKYSGTIISDTHGTIEEVKRMIHLGDAWFYSVNDLLKSR